MKRLSASLLALGLAALLGVVQARERTYLVVVQLRVVEQHTGHEQRSRQRPAPCLVGAGHEARSELAIELEELASGAACHGSEHSAAFSRRQQA